MKPVERELPTPIRLMTYVIAALNFLFVVVALYFGDSILGYIEKSYSRSGREPGGISAFVYGHYVHIWISYAILSAAAFVIGLRFYFRRRLDVEKRIFFIQFMFFTTSLVLVLLFFGIMFALFAPLFA